MLYSADKVILGLHVVFINKCAATWMLCPFNFGFCTVQIKVGLPAQRPIIAGGLRALIILGWKTGPCLNPMAAFSWVSLHLCTWHAMPPIRIMMVGRIRTFCSILTWSCRITSYSDPNKHMPNTVFSGCVRRPWCHWRISFPGQYIGNFIATWINSRI